MQLPFTKEQFFGVLAAYNAAVWPAQVMLMLLAIAMVALVIKSPERAGRFVAFGLAVLWMWVGIAYHLAFFRAINPAATLFAGVSLAAAAVFGWTLATGRGLRFERPMTGRGWIGFAFVVYALMVYPLIGAFIGERYPATPTFGLPCPTTLFTAGFLLMAARDVRKSLAVGPTLWAVIGSSAAFVLGVTQDLGLIAAAIAGAFVMGRRAQA